MTANLGGYNQPGDYFALQNRNGQHAAIDAVAAARNVGRAALAAGGASVVLVEPVPIPGDEGGRTAFFDPYKCLQKSKVDEECRYRADPSPTQLDQVDRDIAAASDKVSRSTSTARSARCCRSATR